MLYQQVFVFDKGTLYFANKQAMASCIDKMGGVVSTWLTGGVHYLVSNNAISNSLKMRKATELGVPVITEKDFIRMAVEEVYAQGDTLCEELVTAVAALASSRYKQAFGLPSFRLRLVRNASKRTGSKVGGFPYWPENMDAPVAGDGSRMSLLVQMNMRDFHGDARLPASGLLQFFFRPDKDYGANHSAPTNQDGFRIVYHANTNVPCLCDEDLRTRFLTPDMDEGNEDNYPFFAETALRVVPSVSTPPVSDDGNIVRELLEDVGLSLSDKDIENVLLRFDEIAPAGGCRVFGYPYSPQLCCLPKWDLHDTLLLRLDSETVDKSHYLMFGDLGCVHFFIAGSHLARLNFADVWYAFESF